MHADLEKLIRLQRAESDLRRVESALADVPRRKAELDAELARERDRLEAARSALEQCHKTRREREGELQSLEAKRSKYKGQLMEVKTNKEYTAVLHEIEAVEREVRACEDQILVEMERNEALTAEIKQEEAAFKEAEARLRRESAALDEEARRLGERGARLHQERDDVAQSLSSDVLALFARVARLRGTGVSEARDEMCQGCRVKLRLQMYTDIKRNESIQQCPSCSRILYYEPPPPTVAVQP